jgi:DNA-directed RNA polymerase specialized sigma24 family protein
VEYIEPNPRLSQMSTDWTMVFQAHYGTPEQAGDAIAQLMCRYAGAIHRYLLKALKDPEVAAELDQEFAVRFLRGDFRACDPGRGRFRDYVKRAVQNLINDHYRRKGSNVSLAAGVEPSVEDDAITGFEREFLESWRKELLKRAWDGLLELERKAGLPYHTVLRSRVDHLDLRSGELAKRVSTALGRSLSAGAFRQLVQRARHKYVNFLIIEVMASLKSPTLEQIEEELSDLELLEFCRPYLTS